MRWKVDKTDRIQKQVYKTRATLNWLKKVWTINKKKIFFQTVNNILTVWDLIDEIIHIRMISYPRLSLISINLAWLLWYNGKMFTCKQKSWRFKFNKNQLTTKPLSSGGSSYSLGGGWGGRVPLRFSADNLAPLDRN